MINIYIYIYIHTHTYIFAKNIISVDQLILFTRFGMFNQQVSTHSITLCLQESFRKLNILNASASKTSITEMLKETRRKEITCYSYTCVAKAKSDK